MDAERTPIVVTGIGVYTPVGTSVDALTEHLRLAQGGIDTIKTFDVEALDVTHAAEIKDYDPLEHFSESEAAAFDRTAQFAILAAEECIEQAELDPSEHPGTGLVAGICAGGRGDDAVTLGDVLPWSSHEAAVSFCQSFQPPQTGALARRFNVTGPTATVSTACASSNSALAYAYDLLQSGATDAILTGGADAFSPTTYAGFYALRAMCENKCAPFSTPIGVTFGEAAGFVMLETVEHAEARDATIYGTLRGVGGSGDAYHITSPHPSGEGLQRAMEDALAGAGLEPEDIGYVNAHGTGTRGNDSAETLAIEGLFEDREADPPPVSSTKSFYGHTLGAAGILEFITGLIAVNENFLPPTLQFDEPRPGCSLDYVPNASREAEVDAFLNNSAAFGGVNASVVGGRFDPDAALPPRDLDDVVVTGSGLVSPIGHGTEAFLDALREGVCGIGTADRLDLDPDEPRAAGMVTDLNPRELVPSVRARRLDPVSTYATVAAGLALKDAGLERGVLEPERVGVVMGLSRGPLNVQEDFLHDMRTKGMTGLSAKHFPAMVVSTIAGKVAKTFQLKGFNSMIVEGVTSGLHAAVHGYERLRQDAGLDAVVVIAADEMGALGLRLYEQLGILSHNGFGPYAALDESLSPAGCDTDHLREIVKSAGIPESAASVGSGLALGEGGAALVLEREASATEREADVRARLSGAALSAGGRDPFHPQGLRRSILNAADDAGAPLGSVQAVYGHGRGAAAYDGREVQALQGLFDRPVPAGCVNGNTGVVEAASGLFSMVAAMGSLQNDEIYPLVSDHDVGDTDPLAFDRTLRTTAVDRVLVTGGTETGVGASVMLDAAS